MYLDIAIIAFCTLTFGCVAGIIERSWVSGPLIFLAVGYAFGPAGFGVFSFSADIDVIKVIAELTLAVVLFNDATGIGIKPLRHHPLIPTRTLLIGLPLTMILGTLIGKLIFPDLPWIQLILIAIILAPTDAALGLSVIKNAIVPMEIRRGLNAESGLNDGICVPFLLIALALAGDHAPDQTLTEFIFVSVIKELGIGILVGVTTTFTGWLLCRHAIKQHWISENWLVIPTLSIALMAFGLAQHLGGSGFIAAFCGGLLFGERLHGAYGAEMETSQINGEVFSLLTWLFFGSLVLNVSQEISWKPVIYALLSLTVIRLLPVLISLLGTPLSIDKKLFIGWFGPRGLASVVFIIMIMQSGIEHSDIIVNTASITIILSVILHGISAFPLSKYLAKKTSQSTLDNNVV